MSLKDLSKLSEAFGENEWCQNCRDWYIGECEECKPKPNYQGIALNNARVIESFDKVLQKRNKEIGFLIEVIHKLEVYEQVENILNSNEVLKLGRIENRVKRKKSTKKDEVNK